MRKIYYNGDFITLENENPEAIVIENDKILKLGKEKDLINLKDGNTEVINLLGKTMMPAFIDSHSHFFAVANNLMQASLNDCTNFKQIQDALLKYKNDNSVEDGKWIFANGYDHNNLEEGHHISKKEIDDILPNNPVVIKHQSGHSGVLNSMGLEMLGITKDTPSPEGGKIEKENGEITGYLEENAFINYLKKIPMPTIDELLKGVRNAQEEYASYGIATAQEGYMTKELVAVYKEIMKRNELFLDIVAFIEPEILDLVENDFEENIKKYKNNLKIGGIKIFLDGSPQSRTAWMRTPYIDDENYFGYGTMNDIDVQKVVKEAYNNNLQILAHCNGDRAAEQYINSLQSIGEKAKKIRPVLIHGQLLGVDQLEMIKKLGVIPSFFVAHTYYWGDVHIKNFGKVRASKISPAGSSKAKDILFTFHQDAPVIKPNMFETIWCAVNRITKSGEILGNDEKIDALDAIKAVTINAAYQYFEEDKKGSIKEGKLADLIILDKNPLKVDKQDLRNVKILETIKNGNTIWRGHT